MRSGARPAPRLGFSIGNGGFWRAWESIAGVQIPHSSTRKCFGEERMSPRAIPGSARRLRHIPTGTAEFQSDSETKQKSAANAARAQQSRLIRAWPIQKIIAVS